MTQIIGSKRERQKFGNAVLDHGITSARRTINGDGSACHLLCFVQYLAASSARRYRIGATADDRNRLNIAKPPLRISCRQRHRFSAERQAKARIFEVRANDHLAIRQAHGRSDRKTAVRGIGISLRRTRCLDQRPDVFTRVHGATTPHLTGPSMPSI